MLQFPDVAGPVIVRELLQRLRMQDLPRPSVKVCIFFQEIIDKQGDIFPPVPKRRNLDLYRINAVEQVFTEKRLSHHLRQVAVRGGNQAYVDRNLPIAPKAGDLAILQGSQELGLQS